MKTLTKKNKIETSPCEECSVYGLEGTCYKQSSRYVWNVTTRKKEREKFFNILCPDLKSLLSPSKPIHCTLQYYDTIQYAESNSLVEDDGGDTIIMSEEGHKQSLDRVATFLRVARGYAKKGGCSRRDDITSQWLDSHPLQRAFKNFSFTVCNKEFFPDRVFNELTKELKRYKTEEEKRKIKIKKSIDKAEKVKGKIIDLMMNAYLQYKDFALLEEVMDYYYLTIYGNMGDTSFHELYSKPKWGNPSPNMPKDGEGLKWIFSSPEEIKRRWEKIIQKLRIASIGKSKKWGLGGKNHLPHPAVFTSLLMADANLNGRIEAVKDVQSKLVLERYYQGGITEGEIAKHIGKSQTTVSRIIGKFKRRV